MVNAINAVSTYIKAHPWRSATRNLLGRPYGDSKQEKALFKLLTLLYCACETDRQISELTDELIEKCSEADEEVFNTIWRYLNEAELSEHQRRQGKIQLNHFIRAHYKSLDRQPAVLIIKPQKCLNRSEINTLHIDGAEDYYLYRFPNDQANINEKIRNYEAKKARNRRKKWWLKLLSIIIALLVGIAEGLIAASALFAIGAITLGVIVFASGFIINFPLFFLSFQMTCKEFSLGRFSKKRDGSIFLAQWPVLRYTILIGSTVICISAGTTLALLSYHSNLIGLGLLFSAAACPPIGLFITITFGLALSALFYWLVLGLIKNDIPDWWDKLMSLKVLCAFKENETFFAWIKRGLKYPFKPRRLVKLFLFLLFLSLSILATLSAIGLFGGIAAAVLSTLTWHFAASHSATIAKCLTAITNLANTVFEFQSCYTFLYEIVPMGLYFTANVLLFSLATVFWACSSLLLWTPKMAWKAIYSAWIYDATPLKTCWHQYGEFTYTLFCIEKLTQSPVRTAHKLLTFVALAPLIAAVFFTSSGQGSVAATNPTANQVTAPFAHLFTAPLSAISRHMGNFHQWIVNNISVENLVFLGYFAGTMGMTLMIVIETVTARVGNYTLNLWSNLTTAIKRGWGVIRGNNIATDDFSQQPYTDITSPVQREFNDVTNNGGLIPQNGVVDNNSPTYSNDYSNHEMH